MNLRWIEQEANSLLKEYSQKTGWEKKDLPVPVSLIAEVCYDMVILYEELSEEVAGELYVDEKLIRVNANDTPERQNFTIGHELGHLRLHVKSVLGQLSFFDEPVARTIICRRNDRKLIEKEANAFSVNLLMPRSLVISAYKGITKIMKKMPLQQRVEMMYDDRWRDLQLAKKFDVSLEAMRYRLMNLKLIDDGKLNYSLQPPRYKK